MSIYFCYFCNKAYEPSNRSCTIDHRGSCCHEYEKEVPIQVIQCKYREYKADQVDPSITYAEPAKPVCRHCGESIYEDGRQGMRPIWLHDVSEYQRECKKKL